MRAESAVKKLRLIRGEAASRDEHHDRQLLSQRSECCWRSSKFSAGSDIHREHHGIHPFPNAVDRGRASSQEQVCEIEKEAETGELFANCEIPTVLSGPLQRCHRRGVSIHRSSLKEFLSHLEICSRPNLRVLHKRFRNIHRKFHSPDETVIGRLIAISPASTGRFRREEFTELSKNSHFETQCMQ